MAPLPPLAAIRVFEAAARHENYSRAAEELALTQAGVSYQIKLLEERLGAPLFVRRGRGVALTELGRRIAPRATEAFAILGDAFSAARAENESVLNVTVSGTFATNWLAARIGDFNIARPELAVRLDVTDRLVDMTASEFDIAIRGTQTPPRTPGLVSEFLVHQMVTPMATPEFLGRHPVRSRGDLLDVPRISPSDEWWDLWFGLFDDLAYESARPKGLLFDSQVLDGNAALASHGVAVLSPLMFRREIATGMLVQIFPEMADDHRCFWLVYPEHKRRLTKVRMFREWLMRSLREAVGDDPLGMLVPPDQRADSPGFPSHSG